MQISSQEFLHTIHQAATSVSKEERELNEDLLFKFVNDSKDCFIEISTQEFQNINLSVATRQMIASFLIIALRPNNKDHLISIWPDISAYSKMKLKETAIACLMNENQVINKSAALLTATIFVLDCVSDKSWLDMLDILAQNIQRNNIENQRTAIMTLGYICEFLNLDKIRSLPALKVDQLLSGICIALSLKNELSNTAVSALYNSIWYLRDNMSDEKFSDFILDLLIDLLTDSLNCKNEETMRNIILCLGEITNMIFDNFGKYAQITFERVLNCYRSCFDSIIVACNEFFIELIKLEKRKKLHYFDLHWENIINCALESLIAKVGVTNSESESFFVVNSLIDLLSNINGIYMEKSFEILISYTREFIESENENYKLSALAVFESMLENSENPLVFDFLNYGFNGIINYLGGGSPRVQHRAMILLCKISQFHPNVFFIGENFETFMIEFFNITRFYSEDEHILELKLGVCDSLKFICYNSRNIQKATLVLSRYIRNIFDLFFDIFTKTSKFYLIDSMMATIFDLIERVLSPEFYSDYFVTMTDYFDFVKKDDKVNDFVRKTIIEGLMINMNLLLLKMKMEDVCLIVPRKDTYSFLDNLFESLYKTIVTSIELSSEELILMGSIIDFDSRLFDQNIEIFMRNFILNALKDVSNFELFKAGLESISFIAKKHPEDTERYINELMPILLENLESNKLVKTQRTDLIYAISDISLYCPMSMIPFVREIFKVNEQNLEVVVSLLSSDEKENRQTAEMLKESLIDCYLCLANGVYKVSNIRNHEFENFLPKLQEFCKITCQPSLDPSVDYIRNCISLIFDIYSKRPNYNFIDVDLVRYLYDILKASRSLLEVSDTLEYVESFLDNL
jgi:hypothetical protein